MKMNEGVILPGSKSIAARALILDRIFRLGLRFLNMPDCDDTRELRRALDVFPSAREYNLGAGGTSLRFFLALAAATPDFIGVLDCSDALRWRPLRPLVDALRAAGADICYLIHEGEAPLEVKGRKLDGDGVGVDTAVSSQFLSALLMISPMCERPFEMPAKVSVSSSYVEMTRRMIKAIGELASNSEYMIESDWSAASYFYEYALLNPGHEVRIDRLTRPEESLQGDSACAAIFAELGVETEFHPDGSATLVCREIKKGSVEFDMCETPDLVPALVVGMCMADICFRITGVSHLRHKESDRLSALSIELAKLGFQLKTNADSIAWEGEREEYSPLSNGKQQIILDSHNDHRIAMALVAAIPAVNPVLNKKSPNSSGKYGIDVKMIGIGAISKSFPDYLEQIKSAL